MCSSVPSNIKLPFVEETPATAPQFNLDASVISVSSLLPFEVPLKAVEILSTHQHCIKSVRFRSYSGLYFPTLGLNT